MFAIQLCFLWFASSSVVLPVGATSRQAGDWRSGVASALEAEFAGSFVDSGEKRKPSSARGCPGTETSRELAGTRKNGSALKLRLCSETPFGYGAGGAVFKAAIVAGEDEGRIVAVKFNTKEFKDAFNASPESGRELMESEIEAASRLGGGMFMEYIGRVDGKTLGMTRVIQANAENGTTYPLEQELTYPGLVMELIDGQTVEAILAKSPQDALATTTACFAAQLVFTFHEEIEKGLMSRDLFFRNAMVSANEHIVFKLTEELQCPKITAIDLGRTLPLEASTNVRAFLEDFINRVISGPTKTVASQPDQLGTLQELLAPRVMRTLASIQTEAKALFLQILRKLDAAGSNPQMQGPFFDGFKKFLRQLSNEKEPAAHSTNEKRKLSRKALAGIIAAVVLLVAGTGTLLYFRT